MKLVFFARSIVGCGAFRAHVLKYAPRERDLPPRCGRKILRFVFGEV